MGIDEKVNQYGQKQIINSFDKIIKMGDKFLQVRLIQTQKWQKEDFTAPMPRAKFVEEPQEFGYFISRDDIIKLKNNQRI